MSTTHLIILLWSLVFVFGGILALIWFTGWAVNDGRVDRHGRKNASSRMARTQAGETKEKEVSED